MTPTTHATRIPTILEQMRDLLRFRCDSIRLSQETVNALQAQGCAFRTEATYGEAGNERKQEKITMLADKKVTIEPMLPMVVVLYVGEARVAAVQMDGLR